MRWGRGVTLVDSLLSDRFSDETSLRLMAHAATLDLADFEDSDIQDGLDRARRQASGRTGLITQLFGLAQDSITLAGFAVGIAAYAPWLILLLAAALVPAFLGELRFNAESYALSAFRTAERRELDYLRQTGASTSTAKEVKLFGLHGFLIDRYRTVSETIRGENAAFARRRATAGAGLAAVGTVGYYAAYGYLAWRTATGALTVGDLTFLAASFLRLRGLLAGLLSGVSTLASQALYLKDLFDFLDVRPSITSPAQGVAFPLAIREGMVFEDVGFRYPGAKGWAVRHLSFRVPAGQVVALVGENGRRQDHAGQAHDPALRPGRGPHPARWDRLAGLRSRRAAGRHRRHLPGFRALRPHGGGQHRGGAGRVARRPGADRAGGAARARGRGGGAARGWLRPGGRAAL